MPRKSQLHGGGAAADMAAVSDPAPPPAPRARQLAVLGGFCAAVVAVYAALGWTRVSELGNRTPERAYYNLLVAGFRAGQLHLPLEVPAGLAALPDPYDPEANAAFRGPIYVSDQRVHDLSYHGGKLYLYFGVTPALLLFWPYTAVTGDYLSHAQAVTVFVSIGFLAGVGLLVLAWRRHFPSVGLAVVLPAAAAFGLASGLPVMLSRPDVWEVPITCGYALVILTLLALWPSLHVPRHRTAALAAASLCYGLAVGARPSLLFGAVILLAPVAVAWTRRHEPGGYPGAWPRLLAAALLPIGLVGAGLAVYNQLRFGSPAEFGQTYQLAGERQDIQHFSPAHLWFNLRAYFLAWGGWQGDFPYLRAPELPPLPAGHGGIENPLPLLVYAPFAWLALAAPLAWRDRAAGERRDLRAFLAAVAAAFALAALVMTLFYGTCLRYEIEFAPALFLLAAFGACGLDRRLAGQAGWRRGFRTGAGVLVLASLAGNALNAARFRGVIDYGHGYSLLIAQRSAEAVPVLESAVRLQPADLKARMDLASALLISARPDAATAQLAETLRRHPAAAPDLYEAYGPVFLHYQRMTDLAALLAAAVAARPDAAPLQHDYGVVLAGLGQDEAAVRPLEASLRLDPMNVSTLNSLGLLARKAGRPAEARDYFGRTLRLDPANAAARQQLQELAAEVPARPPSN